MVSQETNEILGFWGLVILIILFFVFIDIKKHE